MGDDHVLPPSAPDQAPRLPVCDGRRHPVIVEVGPRGLPDLGEPWLHGWYVCPPLLGGCGSFFQLLLTNAHTPRDLARMSYWMGRAILGTDGEEALAHLQSVHSLEEATRVSEATPE